MRMLCGWGGQVRLVKLRTASPMKPRIKPYMRPCQARTRLRVQDHELPGEGQSCERHTRSTCAVQALGATAW